MESHQRPDQTYREPVEPIELAEAEGRIAAAEEQRESGRIGVERLQKLEHQATGWFDLQDRTDRSCAGEFSPPSDCSRTP